MQVHKERKRPKSWSNLLVGFYRQVNRQSLIVSRRRPTSKGDTSWVLDRLAEVIERLRGEIQAPSGSVKAGPLGSELNHSPKKAPVVVGVPAALKLTLIPVPAVNLDSGSVEKDLDLNLEDVSDSGVVEDDDVPPPSLSTFFVEGPLADPDVCSKLQYLVHKKGRAEVEVRAHYRRETDRRLPADERAQAKSMGLAAFERMKAATDSIFSEYLTALGVLEGSRAQFDKKLLDSEMERCFGSLDTEASGLFNYPQLSKLSLAMPFGAVKIFSTYLGRKAFNTSRPQDMEKSLAKTLETLTTPPPPVDVRQEDTFHSRFRRLVKAALHEFKEEDFSPSSGKSCVELSAQAGGKRVAQFGLGADLEGIVRPKAIWSSGKIRVITIGSCQEYERFQTVSAGLFSQVRKAKWCAAGGTIDAWWKSVGKDWQEYSSGKIVSGDLEAATDNLDGRLAEIVFEELAPLILREGETISGLVERMKGSCTRAALYERRCKCPSNAVHGRTCYRYLGRQCRGQLMGSILSFPILCLVTFATFAAFHPIYGPWMEELPVPELRNRLWRLTCVGVNGDDIAFPDEWRHLTWLKRRQEWVVDSSQKVYGLVHHWERGVRIARGVVSRGKTLFNQRYFTINSEIFDRENGRLNVIRPTLLVAVCEQAFKAPMSLWHEMIVSPLMGPRVRELFRPEDVLFPDMPRSMGGLGLCLQSFSEFNPVRYLFLKRVREVPEFAALSEETYSAGDIQTVRGVSTVTRVTEGPSPDPKSGLPTRIVSGWVTKASAKNLSRKRFGVSSNVMRWSTPVIKKFRRVEALKNARADARRLDLRKRFDLYREYRVEFEMSAKGLTYVDSVADPGVLDCSLDPDAVILPIGADEELSLVDRFDSGRPAERQVLEAGIYDPIGEVLQGVKSGDSTESIPFGVLGECGGDPALSYVTTDSTTWHSRWIDKTKPLPASCQGRSGMERWVRNVDRGEEPVDVMKSIRDQFLDRFETA